MITTPVRRASRRRWHWLALAASLLAPTVAPFISPPRTHASGNSLSFESGESQVTVGPNGAIFIDGVITYDTACTYAYPGAITDFVYPATDVYIVPAGTAPWGGKLEDAGGNGPNTIVATTTGVFVGEMIAVATPGGSLGAGTYDVVYDTCQDGILGSGDAVFSSVITVDIPDGELPPVDASINQLKEAARQQYVSWLQAHIAYTALFNLEDAQELLSCILSPSYSCFAQWLAKVAGIEAPSAMDWFKEQTLQLVMNRAKNYGAIWRDPPDADFKHLPVIVAEGVRETPASGSSLADALDALTEPLADEGAISQALLQAIERYQGAQSAGDEEWALIQARAVRDLSAALAEQLSSSTALQKLRDAVASDIDGIDARAAAGAATHARIRTSGFNLDERRALANRGFDAAEIRDLEATFTADGQVLRPSGAQLLADLDALLSARSAMVTALQASEAGWNNLAAGLESRVSSPTPVAVAGGPYVAPGGSAQLDASASTTPDGSSIVAFEWDLDSDGAFDDATGATPTMAVDTDKVVAVRVTNDAGYAAVDVGVVSVTPAAGPTIDTMSPGPAVVATVDQTTTFAVGATGPGGAGVGYAWRFEGDGVASTQPTFDYTPTVDDVGQRLLTVTVTSAGRSASRSWWVSTLDVDADGDGWTATSDCDDTRADVHPGGFERLGNERDDDCDPSTPDAPVGGLAGEVWSWGFSAGLGTGSGQDSNVPVRVTTLPGNVRAVEGSFRAGYALLTDGTVRAWGLNFDGKLGDGTQTSSYVPVTVQNVGGGGALGNVVDLSNDDGHTLALLADGTVRAWGRNGSRELGDGTAVANRLTPVVVLDEHGEPLSGVAQVDTTNINSQVVMQDGTVKVFGLDRCVGSTASVSRPVATTNPLFGHQVVQMESGSNSQTIVLNADGSVLTCAAYTALLGRPVASMDAALTPGQVSGFGPGSGAIDVALGYETGLILKDDGTVWMWGQNLNHSLDVIGVAGGAVQALPTQVPLPPGPPVIDIEMDDAATMYATRADGSVVVWGANVYSGGGVGNSDYAIVGTPTIGLGGGQAISVKNSMWNGLALVRPVAPGVEPVLPIHWIDVTAHDAEIGEATGGAVAITLSEAAPVDVTVDYEFAGTAGSTLVSAGATSVAVPVGVTDDTVDEDDEQIAFSITSVSHGANVARHTATVTVVDDDDAPTVDVADATVDEGNTSLTDAAVELHLSAPSSRDVVVHYATTDGTAVAPGDYTASQGSAVIPAGATHGVVHLAVTGDAALEPTETFSLQLTAAENATVGDGQATVSIRDDEPVVVTVTSPTVTEGNAGTTSAEFTVTVTAPPAGETVHVPWTLVAGTADLGTDVAPGSGELVLGAATPGASIVASVVADSVDEDLTAETFRLAVGAAASSYGRPVVVADTPVATILDDDGAAPVVTVDAGPPVSGSEGSAVGVSGTVTGVDLTAGTATVAWTVNDPQCIVADPAALATSVTCADQTAATLTLTVDDGTGATTSDTAALTISNVAPSVTVTAPANGAVTSVGAAVDLVAAITDPGSDTVTCSVVWGDNPTPTACDVVHVYGAAGSFTITVTADDGDGGVATASVGVVVNDAAPVPGWAFDGFYQPVDNAPTSNVVKAGSTVPVKFGLGGDHGLDIFESGYPASVAHACDGQRGDVLEETATPGASTLTYDPASGRYHYNWKTEKSWAGTCRRLVLRFVDGTEVIAEFRFR